MRKQRCNGEISTCPRIYSFVCELGIPGKQVREQIIKRLEQLHTLVKSRGGAARCLGRTDAVFAHNVAVWKRR
jgi:hypothetical protein